MRLEIFQITIVIVLLLSGCEQKEVSCVSHETIETKQIWIDINCPEKVLKSVLDASDTLNDFVVDVTFVEIVGITDGDDTDEDIITCDDEPRKPSLVGHANSHRIELYIDGGIIESVALHELSHYIGVWGHTDDDDHPGGQKVAVMSIENDGLTDFNRDDADLFSEFFDLECHMH